MPINSILINGKEWRIGQRVANQKYGSGKIVRFSALGINDDMPLEVQFDEGHSFFCGPDANWDERIVTQVETYPEKKESFGQTVSVPMGVLMSALGLCLDECDPDKTNIDLPANIIQDILARLDEVNNQPRAADYYLTYLRSLLNGENPT